MTRTHTDVCRELERDILMGNWESPYEQNRKVRVELEACLAFERFSHVLYREYTKPIPLYTWLLTGEQRLQSDCPDVAGAMERDPFYAKCIDDKAVMIRSLG